MSKVKLLWPLRIDKSKERIVGGSLPAIGIEILEDEVIEVLKLITDISLIKRTLTLLAHEILFRFQCSKTIQSL